MMSFDETVAQLHKGEKTSPSLSDELKKTWAARAEFLSVEQDDLKIASLNKKEIGIIMGFLGLMVGLIAGGLFWVDLKSSLTQVVFCLILFGVFNGFKYLIDKISKQKNKHQKNSLHSKMRGLKEIKWLEHQHPDLFVEIFDNFSVVEQERDIDRKEQWWNKVLTLTVKLNNQKKDASGVKDEVILEKVVVIEKMKV